MITLSFGKAHRVKAPEAAEIATEDAINRASVVSEVIENEAVIINLETGSYYGLNETGSIVWSALQRGALGLKGMTEELTLRYTDDSETIQEAVKTLVAQLLAEGLVVESSEGPVMSPNPTRVPFEKSRAFQAPALEIHTDMQDFLLVDPIHEVDASGHPRPHRK
jgi:hypothetical protein